jgi:hypothetical protein
MQEVLESACQDEKTASSLLHFLFEVNKQPEKKKLETKKPKPITQAMIDLLVQQQVS